MPDAALASEYKDTIRNTNTSSKYKQKYNYRQQIQIGLHPSQEKSMSASTVSLKPIINLILIVTIMINVQREEAEKQLERQNNAKRLMEQNIAELTEDTAEKQVMMMMDMTCRNDDGHDGKHVEL